jgi:hypothetical protein
MVVARAGEHGGANCPSTVAATTAEGDRRCCHCKSSTWSRGVRSRGVDAQNDLIFLFGSGAARAVLYSTNNCAFVGQVDGEQRLSDANRQVESTAAE